MLKKEALNLSEIEKNLSALDNWQLVAEKQLHKTFKFKNFKEALAFTNEIGEIAEDNKHHPDIYLTWGQVTVDITTHDVNGLTEKDFNLAKLIDEL